MKKKSYGHGMFQILFKEVLEQMPPAEADRLIAGYQHGQHIVMVLNESHLGTTFKTSFSADLDMEVRMGSSIRSTDTLILPQAMSTKEQL